ncbi:hypothetical protein [Hydrogenophaga electricum]|uniref:Distant relative of cell wall-associated hydrolase n=1 Tax=Hydrogenophaga electricum TaxID=1230953 RepID=A0ABQ6BZW6_9BURK|nr:hypothetical protein [Hydrogenophaga electricum]GLS13531.1 hypothetical protein GCM10007935_09610 [Hydrogenophaga electricum]
MSLTLSFKDVQPGDVLLCRPPESVGASKLVRKSIAAATGSPYTHAAIALSASEVLDARPRHGVKARPLTELVAEAQHVAVLRHPDAWNRQRVDGLRDYAAALQALGAGYNYREAMRYAANRSEHEDGTMDELARYFDTGEPNAAADFGPFFCSELVAACFVNSGFIHPSAAIVLAPGVQAPGDLAKEPAFGFLVGFLSADPDKAVPGDDPMLLHPRYAEIFGP